jgi:uncharacterized coiled-coil protein SlyX
VSEDVRLEALEIKVAHLEQALQELSDVLYRHQRAIDALEGRHASLLERLEGAGGPSAAAEFEIPPHY